MTSDSIVSATQRKVSLLPRIASGSSEASRSETPRAEMRELRSPSGSFLLGDGQLEFGDDSMLTVLTGTCQTLHLASLSGPPTAEPDTIFLGIHASLQYRAFCADFGPFNLGTTHHVCNILNRALEQAVVNQRRAKIVLYTTKQPTDIANAIYLIGAFLCLHLGATPHQAWTPFALLKPDLIPPFRDATWKKSTFDLYLRDCWSGLCMAVTAGLYSVHSFDQVLRPTFSIKLFPMFSLYLISSNQE